jgi:cytochrome c1
MRPFVPDPNVFEGAMKKLAIAMAALLASCTGGKETPGYEVRMYGSPHRGKDLIQNYGCGSCHTIPGIYTAQGLVGPPLYFFGRRTMIAGELPNSSDNLVRWIRDPKAIEPGTAMPNLGLSSEQAHDIAAYLYTLR